MIALTKTTFTERLIQANALDIRGVARWAIAPGMQFGSTIQWWGDQGQRERPHEGTDLCLYQDREGALCRLREGTLFPAMYGGIVVRLCDDFLGRSVMIECDRHGPGRLYALYGHTAPRPDLEVGLRVCEGEVIASLPPLPPHKTRILPHLHVSLGWAPDPVPSDQLEWGLIPDVLTLLDPVQALDRPVQMMEQKTNITMLQALTAAGLFCSGLSDVSAHHDDYLAEAYTT